MHLVPEITFYVGTTDQEDSEYLLKYVPHVGDNTIATADRTLVSIVRIAADGLSWSDLTSGQQSLYADLCRRVHQELSARLEVLPLELGAENGGT